MSISRVTKNQTQLERLTLSYLNEYFPLRLQVMLIFVEYIRYTGDTSLLYWTVEIVEKSLEKKFGFDFVDVYAPIYK